MARDNKFILHSEYYPTGDQPQAINKLSEGIMAGLKSQTLLGVTGSGKTYTMANVIQNVQKPTLVISHNKTLAGQLYQEFKEFFPDNAVEYFVSYYDYYQPEAYMPSTDTYIAKESDINEEIDKLRLSTTTSLLSRRDVIVVASVSCIYNIGSPKEYKDSVLMIEKGVNINRNQFIKKLLAMHYERKEFDFGRSVFRVKGDNIEIIPAYSEDAYRFEFLEDTITGIHKFNPLTGQVYAALDSYILYPAKHYITNKENFDNAIRQIESDMEARVKELKNEGKALEAHRLEQRTKYDLEMIQEVGYTNGIENYSRYFDGRLKGETPYSLLNYFPNDYLTVVDESHITIPQIRGMYSGDKSRKQTLVDYGFRLPSALDNRPLTYDEYLSKVNQCVFVSATPGEYEIQQSLKSARDMSGSLGGYKGVAEQLIRPTGIVDPKVVVKPAKNQVKDIYKRIKDKTKKGHKVLITTLTKKMAEELSEYLVEKEVKAVYLHADIGTLERMDILESFRKGEHEVIVGINLLREGLDLPEVALIGILDADKEGFLRSETSLIQTMGRAARNIEGEVVLYADNITGSMERAIGEVERRRAKQLEYNKKHNITPKNIVTKIKKRIVEVEKKEDKRDRGLYIDDVSVLSPEERNKYVKDLETEMILAADMLNFELAAEIRDKIRRTKREE